MWKRIQNIKISRISLRLSLYLFILNAFLLLANSTIGYTLIRDVIKTNAAYYAEHYIGALNNELNYYYRDLDSVIRSLVYTNPSLFNDLDLPEQQAQKRMYLARIRDSRDYIDEIIIMNPNLEATATATMHIDQLQKSDIYRKLIGSTGEMVTTPMIYAPIFEKGDEEATLRMLVGSRIMDYQEPREATRGFVIIALKAERLTATIDNRERRYDERLFLVDRKGALMEPTGLGELPYDGEEMLKEAGKGAAASFSRSGHLIVTGNDPKLQPMNIVGIIPEEALLRDAAVLFRLQTALNVSLLLVGMILAFMLSFHFLKPVVRLAKYMDRTGNLGPEFLKMYPGTRPSGNGRSRDEIALLINSFNRMVAGLKEASERLELEREKQRKAEVRALQAQINPHFVYNTLNNIRWLARMGKSDLVFEMLTSVNIILLSAFQLERPLITIGEELQQLAAYVEIQQQIYPGKFRVIYEIEDQVKQGAIARMSLQPLVENAIFHGVLTQADTGIIWIKGWREADCLMVQVVDNGPGGAGTSAAANVSSEREHIGMQNVDRRIRLYFGEGYGVSWEASPGAGMAATIRLPLPRS